MKTKFKTRGLRYYLENYLSREQLDREFCIQMESLGESTCNAILGKILPDCKFKITKEQFDKGKDSDDLLTHLYTHVNRRERNDDWEILHEDFWEYMRNWTPGDGSPSTGYRLYQLKENNISEDYWRIWCGKFGSHYEKLTSSLTLREYMEKRKHSGENRDGV